MNQSSSPIPKPAIRVNLDQLAKFFDKLHKCFLREQTSDLMSSDASKVLLLNPFFRFQSSKSEFHEIRRKAIQNAHAKMCIDLQKLTEYFENLQSSEMSPLKTGERFVDCSNESHAFADFKRIMTPDAFLDEDMVMLLLETFRHFRNTKMAAPESKEPDLKQRASAPTGKQQFSFEKSSSPISLGKPKDKKETPNDFQEELRSENHSSVAFTFFRLKCRLFGIAIPSFHEDDYPLHEAVVQDNFQEITNLLSPPLTSKFPRNPNEPDPSGLTPVLIAIQRNSPKALRILCENGADPSVRTLPYHHTASEMGVLTKSRELITELVAASQRVRGAFFNKHKKLIGDLLESIPDFYVELKWELNSSILPFLSSFTPNDEYKIHKRGKRLRIDFTLVHIHKMKTRRGRKSIVFDGEMGEGMLLEVDHIEKTYKNVFSEITEQNVQIRVDRQMGRKAEIVKVELKDMKVSLKPFQTWTGSYSFKQISGFKTQKYDLGCSVVLETMRNKKKEDDFPNLSSFKSYKEYFNLLKKESFWYSAPKSDTPSKYTDEIGRLQGISLHFPTPFTFFDCIGSRRALADGGPQLLPFPLRDGACLHWLQGKLRRNDPPLGLGGNSAKPVDGENEEPYEG